MDIAGIVAGMVGGYLYWRYVGCTTGTCPITFRQQFHLGRKGRGDVLVEQTIYFFSSQLAATTACGRGSSNNNPVKRRNYGNRRKRKGHTFD